MQTTADKIREAAIAGNDAKFEALIEKHAWAARIEGMNDLLADLHDAGSLPGEEPLITEEGIEFAIENNGASDPRK